MTRPEHSSARIATISGKGLAALKDMPATGHVRLCPIYGCCDPSHWISVRDLRSIFASALTQAPNRVRAKNARTESKSKKGPWLQRRGLKRPRKTKGARVWTA